MGDLMGAPAAAGRGASARGKRRGAEILKMLHLAGRGLTGAWRWPYFREEQQQQQQQPQKGAQVLKLNEERSRSVLGPESATRTSFADRVASRAGTPRGHSGGARTGRGGGAEVLAKSGAYKVAPKAEGGRAEARSGQPGTRGNAAVRPFSGAGGLVSGGSSAQIGTPQRRLVATPKFRPVEMPAETDGGNAGRPGTGMARPGTATAAGWDKVGVVVPPSRMGLATGGGSQAPRPGTSRALDAVRPMTSRPATSSLRTTGAAEHSPVSKGMEPNVRFTSQAMTHAHHEIYHVDGMQRPATGGSEAPLFKESQPQMTYLDRWRQLYLPGGDIRSPEEERSEKFNAAITALKEKIYQKGSHTVSHNFQQLDANNSGALEREDFIEALEMLNLGDCITDEIVDMLVGSLGVDPKEGAKIAYHDFIEAIRMGKVKYITTGRRGRMGPDPDAPFGSSNSATQGSLPYGTMHDAERNLETHDTNVENMFLSLETIFQNYDTKGKGHVDKNQFTAALREASNQWALNLSGVEIENFFRDANQNFDGQIHYKKFMQRMNTKGAKNALPEFFKPKTIRQSQIGAIWAWKPTGPLGASKPGTPARPTTSAGGWQK